VWEIDPYSGYDYPQLKTNRQIRVASVRFSKEPSKTEYNQGDELKYDDVTIEVTYEDGNIVEIPVTLNMLSGYDMNKIGAQTVTLTYGNKHLMYAIEVKEKLTAPKSLKVTSTKKGKLKISWKKVTSASRYRVYYSTKKKGTYKVLANTKKTSITKKLKSKKVYYIKVVAIGRTGTVGKYSSIKRIKVK
jgi:hypothetical protein